LLLLLLLLALAASLLISPRNSFDASSKQTLSSMNVTRVSLFFFSGGGREKTKNWDRDERKRGEKAR
jgi:hypothetical protein